MILSNDTIMNPPYDVTPKIMSYISSISEKLGEVNANYLNKQSPQLRKTNQIKTIQASLQIEGNTLSEDQITALVEKKRVIGPQKDITEVLNALNVYEHIANYNCISEKHFLKAHGTLMQGLIENPGSYRKKLVYRRKFFCNHPFFAHSKGRNRLPFGFIGCNVWFYTTLLCPN